MVVLHVGHYEPSGRLAIELLQEGLFGLESFVRMTVNLPAAAPLEAYETFIDNVSIEYRLDNSGTRYVKLFHDKNYESVLEGEIIETGVGIVLRKKMSHLGELFIFKSKKKK